MKILILCALLLTGCTNIPVVDNISNVFTIANVAKEISKPQLEIKEEAEVAIAEEKWYDENHNWNNTKVEPIKILKKSQNSKSKEKVKKEILFPWPIFWIFLLSGIFYIINRIRIYMILRNSND